MRDSLSGYRPKALRIMASSRQRSIEWGESGAQIASRAELRIQLLGEFSLTVPGRELNDSSWRLRKAGHLIKLLALARHHRLQREQVMEWLWPDLAPQAAANNLYQTLHVVRRTLNPAPAFRDRYVQSQAGELILAPESSVWIDVDAFKSMAEAARRSSDSRAYEDAIALYAGDLLPQDRYEPWTEGRRRSLRHLFLTLLLELAQLHRERGELDLAIERYRCAVALDPPHEAAHVELIRLYASVGLRHQALRQYQELRSALRRELDIEPALESTRLYRAVLSGNFESAYERLDDSGARIETPEPAEPRHNLPAEVSSFVGREREFEDIRSLLAGSRLVTLTGPGGIGKTRLALAVARRELDEFDDGVVLVSLAAVRNPILVPSAVARALGVDEAGDRPLLDALTSYLMGKRLLLVLDNLEHLAPVGPLLIELLDRCPDLKLLITSRVRLHLAGEREYPIPPLDLPDAGLHIPTDRLSGYAALALFIQRSTDARPDFRPTGDNTAAIIEICRRLDGVPLAIELAAARGAVLTPESIVERLDRPLVLLTGGSPDLPRRQQTVRDTIAWSYDLLPHGEQRLLQRLSVFTGGWTLEAAEAVVQGVEPPSSDVLDGLTTLIDHSLVRTEEVASRFRFGMLETIHEFALEQLEAAGEVENLRQRHAEFFLDLAEQADSGLLGADEVAWLDRLEREIGNLRVALDWCAGDSGDALTGLRLAGALWNFWDMRGRATEGRRWLQTMLAKTPGRGRMQARALFAVGYLATRQGDRSAAHGPLEQALEIYREVGHKPGESQTLAILGTLVSFEGDFARSTMLLEQALAVFRETGDRLGVARILLDLGDQVRAEGDYRRARLLLSESLDLFRELEISHGAGWALTNLGNIARADGDIELARSLQEESRAVFRELGDKRGLARPVLYLANLARARGDYEQARALFHESLEMLHELRDQWRLPVWFYYVGFFAAQQLRFSSCVRLIAAANASHERFDTLLDPAERDEGDAALAAAREALGDEDFSAAWADGEALTLDDAIAFALDVLDRS